MEDIFREIKRQAARGLIVQVVDLKKSSSEPNREPINL